MSKVLILLGVNIPAMLCIGCAAWMAVESIGGWGWFLFAGLCLGYTYGKRDDDETEASDE